jgi:hypothetical protein
MRTLNRPMFRYGGPIKEGIMSGIREPKRNGGSMMGNNEGPRRAALVGNPIYPNVDGRTNHLFPALLGAGAAALRYLPKVYRGIRGAKYVKGFKPTGVFRNVAGKDPSPAFMKGDPTAFAGSYNEKLGVLRALKDPTRLGGAIRENPGTASSIASLLGYGGKKLFNNEPENKNKNNETNSFGGGKRLVGTSGSPGGGDPGAYLEPRAPEKEELTAEQIKAAENKLRREQMDTYREIMDIKGMNKDAAYKSLIDASKIIQEGGNLKKQIKDGSLIANITQAASKRFDKVGDTEAALRSLVAKGEIQNEIDKEKNALENRKTNLQIQAAEKTLAGLTTGEMIQQILGRAQGEYPKGDALRQIISINNPQLNAKVIPTGDMPTGADALEYAVSMINKRNNDETTPDYPEGFYVIKDRVIKVIDGQVIPVPINNL